MHLGVYSSNMAWEKVFSFLKSHLYKKPNHNCLRIPGPIHFAANRFTFEKNLPPPPLLHSLCAASRMWVRHRSVVIVPPEGGLEFSAGLTKKIVFYSCHG